jgi:hypothetical protein
MDLVDITPTRQQLANSLDVPRTHCRDQGRFHDLIQNNVRSREKRERPAAEIQGKDVER